MSTAVKNALLITGTDTEVGKTVVTTAIAAYWLQHFTATTLGLMKPVQSGIGDFETYTQLFDLAQTPDSIAPQRFAAPLAPPLAAAQEGKTIDLTAVWQQLNGLLASRQLVLMEALGGLGSPVTDEWTVADLAAAWHLPTVLVVPVKLGAIGQAVANTALAQQKQLTVKGIILNCTMPLTVSQQQHWAPVEMIERLTQLPVLGQMPYLEAAADLTALATAASNLNLEALLPRVVLQSLG